MVERLSLFLFGRNPERTMKLKIYFFIVSCFISVNVFAQSPKAIEKDLDKLYAKREYWSQKIVDDETGNVLQSMTNADEEFGEKLTYYASNYPFTINYKFNWFENGPIIVTSDDSLFRIYSWGGSQGGTEQFFYNVIQYKTGKKTNATFYDLGKSGQSRPDYYEVHTLKVNEHTYYLAIYSIVGSTMDFDNGIQVFAIENGKLNDNVKLIRTKSGLHSRLSYSIHDRNGGAGPEFDAVKRTITLPLIDENGTVTDKFITYKFTGQYFEKVK
jgi:hypothetical protein